MKEEDRKRLHRLLMKNPMLSDRKIAKMRNCDPKDVREMRREIWARA